MSDTNDSTMDFAGMLDRVSDTVREFTSSMESVTGDRVGLDRRVGTILISPDAIGVRTYNRGSLEYYGGFEYVSKEHRVTLGDFTFYMRDDPQVDDHVTAYYESKNEFPVEE